ncbi:MAG: hypothetical protein Q4G33_13215, partial [bacterium]|nr:hypothetical protein [bacterium]
HHHHSESSSGHHHHSEGSHRRHSSYYPYGGSDRHNTRSKYKKVKKMNKRKSSHSSHRSREKGYKRKVNRRLILAVVLSAFVFLSIAGYAAYKIIIVPRLVEPALEKAAEVMLDDKYTSAITKEIRRLYEAGQVSGPEIEKYLTEHDENVSNYIPDAVYKGTSDTPTAAAPAEKESSAPKAEKKSTSKSSLGISSVNVREDDEDHSSADNTDSSSYDISASNEYSLDSSSSGSEKKTQTSKDLYAKAKEVMTASDFSTAVSIGSKIDVSKAKSLMNDQNALMSYIQSTLTPDEYSTAISLYAKYSNAILE